MKLQNQVCTREQGQRLGELGIELTSIFSHFKAPSHAGICLTEIAVRHVAMLSGQLYDRDDVELYPAYTVAELGQMLGEKYFSWHDGEFWCCGSDAHSPLMYMQGLTEAEARAEELISNIECSLLTVEEANKRMNQ